MCRVRHAILQVEKLADAVLPVSEIVKRCPAKQLMTIYKIAGFTSTDGKLKKGGTADVQVLLPCCADQACTLSCTWSLQNITACWKLFGDHAQHVVHQ